MTDANISCTDDSAAGRLSLHVGDPAIRSARLLHCGQAKSGTTLLVALLDNHPELLVLPEETAYFPTVLTKFGKRSRREQFDYLTKESLSNVVFGGPCKWGKRDYSYFPTEKFLHSFEERAFDPAKCREGLAHSHARSLRGDAWTFARYR